VLGSYMEQSMKDLAITINGVRYRAKNLEYNFAKFIEDSLEDSGVTTNKDNAAKELFSAYLHLAKKYYKCEQEIEDIIRSIEL